MDKVMIIRSIVLVFALINQALVLAGYSPLPFDNAQIENFFTVALTVIASIWAWWKDNDVTRKARARKQAIKDQGL